MAFIDTQLNGVANVLALIEFANPGLPIALTASNVTLGVPQERTPSEEDGNNTQVVITAEPGGGYSGTLSVTYTRVGVLTQTTGDYEPPIVIGVDTTPQQAKEIIAPILGLVDTDITIGTLPAQGSSAQVTISAVAGSYLYIGSGSVLVSVEGYSLPELITDTTLDGFDIYEP